MAKSPNVVSRARAKKDPKPKGSRIRAVWEQIKSLAGAVLIYLVIRTFLVEAFRIPSGSMIPTLLVGDWLFVNKAVYGPTIPFTDIHLPGYSDPKHGDVVVFVSPPQFDNGADSTPTLVKRLIGMPGDTLYMRAGVLYLNGLEQRPGFGARPYRGDSGQTPPDDVSPDFVWQKKYALDKTRFGSAPAVPTHDSWGPLLVPAGHYFMMGDNRYCSKDSRYWGIVPRANVRGQPLFVYYSYVPGSEESSCDGDVSDRPVSFITDIRWSRLFHRIR